MSEMTKAERAAGLRAVWVQHGLRTPEQANAMTDDEVIDASLAMIRRFGEAMRPLTVAVQETVARIGKAFAPLARDPGVMAEMERQAAERRRA